MIFSYFLLVWLSIGLFTGIYIVSALKIDEALWEEVGLSTWINYPQYPRLVIVALSMLIGCFALIALLYKKLMGKSD